MLDTLVPSPPRIVIAVPFGAAPAATPTDAVSGRIIYLRPTAACFIRFGSTAAQVIAPGTFWPLERAETVRYKIGTADKFMGIVQVVGNGTLYIYVEGQGSS